MHSLKKVTNNKICEAVTLANVKAIEKLGMEVLNLEINVCSDENNDSDDSSQKTIQQTIISLKVLERCLHRRSRRHKKKCFHLVKHYELDGVSCRMHANTKRRPWNAAPFAEKRGLSHPSRTTLKFVQFHYLVECLSSLTTASCYSLQMCQRLQYTQNMCRLPEHHRQQLIQLGSLGTESSVVSGLRLYLSFVFCHQLMPLPCLPG